MPLYKILKPALFLLLFPSLVFAQIRPKDAGRKLIIADPLQSNMVVQQDKPFKIWGHAPAGKTVLVSASWLGSPVSVVAEADNRFMAVITVPAVKKGDYTKQSITVTSENEKVVLSNLLIGDVWFCSGQSNMQFALRYVIDADKQVDSASNPNLRLLLVNFSWHANPVDTIPGHWAECSPQSVKEFSAVGYYFAKEIQKRLDIPVGVIYSGVGGSVTQAYVSENVLMADSLLNARYLEPFYKTDDYKNNKLEAFSWGTTSYPYLIYNGMIYPFFNLSIKGFLWYQGESNREQRDDYVKLNYTMINSWRKNFQQGELPFYYVQVAPHAYKKLDSTLYDYAYFREKQEEISRLSNTAMVTTMDVGDRDDIHPKNKKPVGLRLAYTALNRTYGMLNVPYRGPQYHHVVFEKRKATIYFDPAITSGGLRTNDGKAPAHFWIAGDDKIFHPADAKIDGNTMVVTCKEVKKPVAVRYAFTNYPITNLENGAGIPAVPFRTDDWPEDPAKMTSFK